MKILTHASINTLPEKGTLLQNTARGFDADVTQITWNNSLPSEKYSHWTAAVAVSITSVCYQSPFFCILHSEVIKIRNFVCVHSLYTVNLRTLAAAHKFIIKPTGRQSEVRVTGINNYLPSEWFLDLDEEKIQQLDTSIYSLMRKTILKVVRKEATEIILYQHTLWTILEKHKLYILYAKKTQITFRTELQRVHIEESHAVNRFIRHNKKYFIENKFWPLFLTG